MFIPPEYIAARIRGEDEADMPSKPWTPQEEQHLAIRFVGENQPYSVIAAELDRPVEEVRRKGQKMGLWASVRWDQVLAVAFDRARLLRCGTCGAFSPFPATRCAACGKALPRSSARP